MRADRGAAARRSSRATRAERGGRRGTSLFWTTELDNLENKALAATKGDASADALIPALEGVSLKSPRGAVAFDKATHGLVQDIYIREVRASATGVVNAVIDRIPKVADPGA